MAAEDEKQELRRTARETRRAAHTAAGDAAQRLVANFHRAKPGFGEQGPSAIIAGYWPIADEIDVRPLLAALYDQVFLTNVIQQVRSARTRIVEIARENGLSSLD